MGNGTVHFMDGKTYTSEGRNIDFMWRWNEEKGKYELHFRYDGRPCVTDGPDIDDGRPAYEKIYHCAASWAVDDYIENRLAEEEWGACVRSKTQK